MKTFYTILKLSPNTVAGDSLSIGLLVCIGNEYWLKISETKKNVVKKLLGDKSKSVDFVLKQLENYLKQLKNQAKKEQLFALESFITIEYIDYLNVYSNGLLQFSKASIIDDTFDNDKFLKLYSLLVDKEHNYEITQVKQVNSNLIERVQNDLIKKVENKIHTEITLNNSVLKSLYFNFDMDCIGLNGSFVGAKSFPLENSIQTLEKNISHYVTLIAFLSQQYQKDLNNNKFFLITDEPEKNTQEHKFWKEMKDVPSFEMIPSNEAEKVAEIVEKTGASTFLQIEE